MSQTETSDVSISVNETGEKVEGKRVVDGYILELSNTLPCHAIEGRSDYFQGKGYKLSVEQAEAIYKQLGESLAFVKPLIDDGKIIVKRPGENFSE